MVLSPIHSLEVLCDGLVHLIPVADEMVLSDNRSHYWVAALHPEDLFGRGIKGLQVACSEDGAELINYLVVV